MRAFGWFLGAVLLAVLAGALIAYPAFELASQVGGWAFHRVASRIAMLLLALELVWLCRRLRLRSKRDFGYGLARCRFFAVAGSGGLVGVATAALGVAFLMATGLRVVDPSFVGGAAGIARLGMIGIASGLSVALIEETVMRGAMHTAIERESGPWTAALLTAPLFAVLHFFAKVRIPSEEVGWGSGFDLLVRSFMPLSHPALVTDAFLSWLAVGLLLSLTRVLTGNIAVAIGLHAGWVMVLRMLSESTVRGASPAYAIWVGQFDGILGYWLLPWAASIGAALWLTRARWARYARGNESS